MKQGYKRWLSSFGSGAVEVWPGGCVIISLGPRLALAVNAARCWVGAGVDTSPNSWVWAPAGDGAKSAARV